MSSVMDQSPVDRLVGEAAERNPYECSTSYQDHWRAYLEKQRQRSSSDATVVLDCCIARLSPPTVAANDAGTWVWACTSLGSVFAWKVPPFTTSDGVPGSSDGSEDGGFGGGGFGGGGFGDDDEWMDPDNSSSSSAAPARGGPPKPPTSLRSATRRWRVRPEPSALCRLKIASVASRRDGPERVMLFVAGTGCGVLAFDVEHLLSCPGPDTATSPPPVGRYEPYPRPYGAATVLDFEVSAEDNVLTAMADDDWGLYRWRLDAPGERLPVPIAHRRVGDGPITCFHSFSDPSRGASALLVGTESGMVYRMDDADDTKRTDAMETNNDGEPSPHAQLEPAKVDVRALLQLPGATVTHIVRINHCWWTVVGTTSASAHGAAAGVGTTAGYVATIHAPTQSLVRSVPIRGTPQRVLYLPHRHHVAILTNSSIVEHFQVISLERQERKWTTLKSCHGVAAVEATAGDAAARRTPASDWTVICGVGEHLDVYRGSTRIAALAASLETLA